MLTVFAAGQSAQAIDISNTSGTRRQTFEGWGTSLAWWGNGVGGWNDSDARSDLIDAVFDSTNGLGLTYARYNIGGGQNRLYSGNMRPGALVQGWVPNAPTSVSDTSTWAWNWQADATQRRVLDEAIAKGAARVDAISYSAPYWMTYSQDTAGNVGGTANLPPANYDELAFYQAEVVEHFYDNLGVRFQAFSPLNEPNVNWWVAGGRQEGMVVPAGQPQRDILQAVGQAFAARNLPIKLAAGEETNSTKAVSGWQLYDAATKAYISHVHTHTYGGDQPPALNQLRSLAAADGKKVYMSEYGNNSTTGLLGGVALAGRITHDLNELGAHGWAYWQVVEPGELTTVSPSAAWGMLWTSYGQSHSGYTVRKQFHVMRQFTSYLGPDSVVLDTTDDNTLAGYDPISDSTVVIGTNPDAAAVVKSYTFTQGTPAFTRVIQTTELDDFASLGSGPGGATIALSAPGPSVTTLVAHHKPNLAANSRLEFAGETTGATQLGGGWRAAGGASFSATTGPGDTAPGLAAITSAGGAVWQEGIGGAANDLTGKAYQLSLDVQFKQALAEVYAGAASIGLEFYGADGQTLAHANVSDYAKGVHPLTDDTTWRTFRTPSVMAPAGTRYVRPVVRVVDQATGGSGTVRLDNVYLQEINYRHRGRKWLPTGGGSATLDSNWEFDASRAEHDRYFFGPTITAAATVSLAGDTAVRQMTFDSAQLYRLAGAGRIVLQGAEAMIDARSGSHQVQAPVLLQADAVFQAVGDAVLTVSGAIDLDGHTLRTQGGGSIRLNGALTFDGGALEVFAKPTADVTLGAAAATLNGTLRVLLGPGATAGLGDAFELLTFTAGATSFTQVEMPLLASGLEWRLDYEPTRLLATVVEQLLYGDYNDDGLVDAADYSVWRDNVGAPTGTLPNDPNAGPIGPAQYATWAAGLGSSSAPAVAVPEPATAAIALLAVTAGLLWGSRRATSVSTTLNFGC